MVARNIKVKKKVIVFCSFFLSFEYFFDIFPIFEQKHVLKHQCAFYILCSFDVFNVWLFCSLI